MFTVQSDKTLPPLAHHIQDGLKSLGHAKKRCVIRGLPQVGARMLFRDHVSSATLPR